MSAVFGVTDIRIQLSRNFHLKGLVVFFWWLEKTQCKILQCCTWKTSSFPKASANVHFKLCTTTIYSQMFERPIVHTFCLVCLHQVLEKLFIWGKCNTHLKDVQNVCLLWMFICRLNKTFGHSCWIFIITAGVRTDRAWFSFMFATDPVVCHFFTKSCMLVV